MLKKLMKKEEGFTLAELLIVVAIIAVLVAVSIPIFTAQLEKSRESTDFANLRAAKAAAVSALLTDESPLVTINADGERTINTCSYDIVSGTLVTGATGAAACGKGTDQKPNDTTVYTNEYGYNGSSVAGQRIVVAEAMGEGNSGKIVVHFTDQTGTPLG